MDPTHRTAKVCLVPSLRFAPASQLSPVPPPAAAHGARSRGWSLPPLLWEHSSDLHTWHVRGIRTAPFQPALIFGQLVESIRSRERAPIWEDDGSGAAAISDGHRERGRHVARAALGRQAAHGAAARAGSSAHHQEEQVQTGEERLAISLTHKYDK